MKGEILTDNRVWIKKTAFPNKAGKEFVADKCILVVRKYEFLGILMIKMISFFNVILDKFEEKIQSMNTMVSFSLMKNNEQLLNTFINSESELIKEYFDYWKDVPLPLYILRIEDLLFDPEKSLLKLLAFLFNTENLKGSVIENKILMFLKYNKYYTSMLEEIIKEEKEIYDHYNNLQKNMIIRLLKDELMRFGYLSASSFAFLQDKKMYEDHELTSIFDVTQENEFLYKDINEGNIKKVCENMNKKTKFFMYTSLKINNSTDFKN